MSLIRRHILLSATLIAAVTGFNAVAHAAGCYDGGQQLSPSAISNFTGNPGSALSAAPNGGGALISQIRDLAATDSSTMDPILGLLKDANEDQKKAIGAGLAQAARICVSKDQAYANKIQQDIADSKDPTLVLAYASSAGNEPIGAGPGGAGASPGGLGGATTGAAGAGFGGGPAEGIGGNGVNTGQFTYSVQTSNANNSNSSVSP